MKRRTTLFLVVLAFFSQSFLLAEERRQIGQARSGRPHNFLATGGEHTLMVSEGRVFAWGNNTFGQLGDGKGGLGVISRAPVKVSQPTGLAGVIAVATGHQHSLALDSHGAVWAWGNNTFGQLGDGSIIDRMTPVKLTGIFTGRITAIAAGNDHSIALDASGEMWVWGHNNFGQLGNGSAIDSTVPIPLTGLAPPGVKAISAGIGHSLALDARGQVWSWGLNNRGQLGRTALPTDFPVQINYPSPPQRFIEIAAGSEHSLAIEDNGTLWAWGADSAGQLGNGATAIDQVTPIQVNQANGFTRAVRIAAGAFHSMALTAGGTVYAWGANSEGQIGDGATLPGAQQNDPFLVSNISGLPGATAIAAGFQHSAALRSDGKLLTWGSNIGGQIGNGGTASVSAPIAVPTVGLRGVIATAGSWKQSYNLRGDGTVWAWGDNTEAQLGDGSVTSRNRPQPVPNLQDIIAFTGGNSNGLALRSDGTVWAWGQNIYSQMGPGASPGFGCPTGHLDKICVAISIGLTDVKAIAAGTYFHLAIKDDGSLWAWGQGVHGQLGDNATANDPNPKRVLAGSFPFVSGFLEGVISVAAGGGHTVALLSDGTIAAWGRNTNCELGLGGCCNGGAAKCQPQQLFPADVLMPTPVGLGLPMTAVSTALYHHTLVLDQHGQVWAWGVNDTGQLGDGALPGVSALSDMVRGVGGVGVLQDITAIAAGGFHSLGLGSDGTLYGWGANSVGQLGHGTTISSPYPQAANCMPDVISLPSGTCVQHAVVRKDDWTRCGAGLNDFGQLGDATNANKTSYICDTSIVGTTMRFDVSSIGRLFWEPHSLAQKYYVYRGLRLAGSAFAYNHNCITPGGVLVPQHIDTTTPTGSGELLYYLVSARTTAACGESDLGRDSGYALRPNTAACPP